jgi:hypothetical protein
MKKLVLASMFWVAMGGFWAPLVEASVCPLPKPNQIVIYQNASRGDPCKVLEIGDYPKSAYLSPVANDSLTAVDVGSNLRAVLYEHDFFAGRQAHVEGGFYYDSLGSAANDQTSSIEIFPKPSDEIAVTYYLGNYPSNQGNFFSESAEGVAHDESAWFLTTSSHIYRVPFSYDLNEKSAPALHKEPNKEIPDSLKTLGYNHFGDPDVSGSTVFVPMDGKPPRVAMFRTSDLAFLGSMIIPNSPTSGAPWLAIHPITGNLWTSPFCIGQFSNTGPLVSLCNEQSFGVTYGLREYRFVTTCFSWACYHGLSFVREVILRDRDGFPIDIRGMQGGVFSPNGQLFYQSNGYGCELGGDGARIRAFYIDTDSFFPTGTLQARSENGYGPFDFENHPATSIHSGSHCPGDEPEGIDYLDVRVWAFMVFPMGSFTCS